MRRAEAGLRPAVREKSAGAVLFRMVRGRRRYLLLHNVKGHWDFPKGKVERGETVGQAMRREVEEETGIRDFRVVPHFGRLMRWRYRRGADVVAKTAVFRLACTRENRLRLSCEHKAGRWLEFSDAGRKIEFTNARNMLRCAERFLAALGRRRPLRACALRGLRP